MLRKYKRLYFFKSIRFLDFTRYVQKNLIFIDSQKDKGKVFYKLGLVRLKKGLVKGSDVQMLKERIYWYIDRRYTKKD